MRAARDFSAVFAFLVLENVKNRWPTELGNKLNTDLVLLFKLKQYELATILIDSQLEIEKMAGLTVFESQQNHSGGSTFTAL